MLCHLVAWIEQSIPDELLVNPDVQPDPTNQYLKIEIYDHYRIDVLWGQPIKLIQVASSSEYRENQQNDFLFFEIVPSYCFGASEASTIDCFKN